MDLYGFMWIYMDLHGFIWIYKNLHGFTEIYMDLHGFTWIYMDLYGFNAYIYMVDSRCQTNIYIYMQRNFQYIYM